MVVPGSTGRLAVPLSTTAEPAETHPPAARPNDTEAPGRRLRLERSLLLAFVLIGLVRGLFWVAMTEVWNPIDETAHFAYVESLATGKGIPEVGHDLVSDEVLGIAKQSPTDYSFRSRPYRPTASDGNWAGTRHQYEAIQGPVYYTLMVPFYWIGRPFGFLTAVYAVRIGSLLLSLAAVPLTWMLGRRLFPRRRWVGLTAAGLLVFVNGFNANMASASNDSLAVVASAAAVLLFLRALRGRPGQVLAAGLCFGVAVVNKTTALELVPLLGIALLVTVLRAHWKPRALFTWAGLFVTGSMAALAPWLAFNFATYGAPSAASQVASITGGTQEPSSLSMAGLKMQLLESGRGFWELQAAAPGVSASRKIMAAAMALAVVVGLAVALVRKQSGDAARLAWLAVALPLAFVVMMGIVFGVLGGQGATVGRHYYPVLVPTVLLISAGADLVLGGRRGILAVLALSAVLTTAERGVYTSYSEAAFGHGRIANTVPLVDQSWNDGFVAADSVAVDAPCATTNVALVFEASPPGVAPPVTVDSAQGSFTVEPAGVNDGFTVYTTPTPVAGRLAIRFGRPTSIGASLAEREAKVAIPGRHEDPVVRVYCRVADPVGAEFAERYDPLHPRFLNPGRIETWADGWTLVAWTTTVIVAVGLVSRRRVRRPDENATGTVEIER